MFSQVSVCPQGGVCPIACCDTPPRAGTPPWAGNPSAGTPPSACCDTVNKWAVRIQLECILVPAGFWSTAGSEE